MKKLIAFVGFKSSGKNTAAEALIPLGYVPFSFADSLKDAVAAIFCWDRQMLEGTTAESREWREKIDTWWAEKLGIPHFTPRWMMQNFGTEIMRKHFNNDIWISNVERRIMDTDKAVITDARFPNEIKMIKSHGGYVIRIKRGPEPEWYEEARLANMGNDRGLIKLADLGIHPSESSWIGEKFHDTIENDSSVEQLHMRVLRIEGVVKTLKELL